MDPLLLFRQNRYLLQYLHPPFLKHRCNMNRTMMTCFPTFLVKTHLIGKTKNCTYLRTYRLKKAVPIPMSASWRCVSYRIQRLPQAWMKMQCLSGANSCSQTNCYFYKNEMSGKNQWDQCMISEESNVI
ncbi:hypothetical protein FKM82_009997 [Ascaphus truei]